MDREHHAAQRPCPLCESTPRTPALTQRIRCFDGLFADRLARTYVCEHCGAIYVDPGCTEADLLHHYREESTYLTPTSSGTGGQSAADQERYRTYYERLQGLDPTRARVADIGCGKGGGLHFLREQGFRTLVGVEPDERAVDVARSTHGLDVRVGALPSLPIDDSSLDAILCGHVLEHLLDPIASLRELRRVLRPGGRLLIEVPDAEGYASWPVFDSFWLAMKEHVGHFTLASLRRALWQVGLRPLEMRRGALPVVPGVFYPSLIVVAEPGLVPDPGLGDPRGGAAFAAYVADQQRRAVQRRAELRSSLRGKVAAWGLGQEFFALLQSGALDVDQIHTFVDRDPSRQARTIGGRPVVDPGTVLEAPTDTVLITATFRHGAITETLGAHQFPGRIVPLHPRSTQP